MAPNETLYFIAHKMWRLFPLYILGFLSSFIAGQYVSHLSLEQIIKNIFHSTLAFLRVGTTVGLIENEPLGVAWYISAMLLSMLMIYPIVQCKRTIYTHIIAPLLCTFIYGYLQYNYRCASTLDWLGVCTAGLLRGIAGISLGCIAFEIGEKILSIKWTKLGKKLLTILEIGGYVLALIHMKYLYVWGSNDFVIVAILVLSVAISGSCKSYSNEVIKGKTAIWAELGLALYMGHMSVRILVLNSERLDDFKIKFIVYVIFSLLLSFILRLLGVWLKKFLDWCMEQIKNACIMKP